ncbi:MFS transporter [Corynebacterium flavescens]
MTIEQPAAAVGSAVPDGANPKDAIGEIDSKNMNRIAFSAFIGTALEWYDFFLFGTASALVFNHLFFVNADPAVAALASFATFGVGFLARPLGAILFGKMGDKYGRRPALILSIVVIGAATGVVGLLPDYFAIGIAAPILLTLLRLFQGVAVGGEWGGATALAIEHAPVEKRGRYAALIQIGSPAGTLLSSGAFALVFMLPTESFDAWGWRLPFLAAFPFLVIALLIRLHVEESPVFKALEEEVDQDHSTQGSLRELFSKYWRQIVIGAAASLTGIGGFFVMSTYALSYGSNVLGLDRQDMVTATMLGAVAQVAINLFFGRFAERVGSARVVVIGGILSAVLAVPLWLLINTGNVFAVGVAIVVGLASVTVPYSVIGVLLGAMFPAHVRYSGMAIAANIAGAISGLLPFLATWMNSFYAEQSTIPAIVILCLISVLTAIGGFVGGKMADKEESA